MSTALLFRNLEFGASALVMGAKASKSHLPKEAPPPAEEDKGEDTFHFALEKENIEIQYEIDDRFGAVSELKLEVFTRFQEKALYELDLTPLGSDWWKHGKHIVKWDGRLSKKPTAEQKGTVKGDDLEHDLTQLAVDDSAERLFSGRLSHCGVPSLQDENDT